MRPAWDAVGLHVCVCVHINRGVGRGRGLEKGNVFGCIIHYQYHASYRCLYELCMTCRVYLFITIKIIFESGCSNMSDLTAN